MKTFKDLEWHTHPIGQGLQALCFFPNGYGISVIRFKIWHGHYASYTNNEDEWEAMALKGNATSWELNGQPKGHLSEEEVTAFMQEIQERKAMLT